MLSEGVSTVSLGVGGWAHAVPLGQGELSRQALGCVHPKPAPPFRFRRPEAPSSNAAQKPGLCSLLVGFAGLAT